MEKLLIIFVCLFLNAILAAYEMAFVSVSKSELRSLARKGNKSAQTLLELRDDPERTLSIIQIGITLVGALAAAVSGAGAAENFSPFLSETLGLSERNAEALAVGLVVVPLTYLSVVIGELVPKSLALRNPRKIVLAGTSALFLADRILAPIISVLEYSTKAILNLFFRRQSQQEKNLAQASVEIDTLSPTHQKFVINMVNIEKKKVRDILLPWDQVVYVQITDSVDEVAHTVFSSGHTRLPVREKNKVIGILHTKEFMTLKEAGETQWQSIVRPYLAVKLNNSALGVLRLMQENRSHLCVVFSEEDEHLGIVTLEDIIEEVVGDIFDEDDDGRIRKIFATRKRR